MSTETTPGSQLSKTKIKRCDVFDTIADVISRSDMAPLGWKQFPESFHVFQADASTRIYLKEKHSGVLELVRESALVDAILNYCRKHLSLKDDAYRLDPKMASSLAKYWLATATPIPAPALVRFLSDPGYCYSRLAFDLLPKVCLKDAPVFSEFLERCSNADALCAWIGSLLVPEADCQQYVWLYGEGQNGKGSIARFLDRVFDSSYKSLSPPDGGANRFFNIQLVGCRVGCFIDCNNTTFVTSGHMKSLTGGDSVLCEGKGQVPFKANLNVKFAFLSNEKPNISSEKADMRRIIYCEVKPIVGDALPKKIYDDKLWEEAQTILTYCLKKYHELCPSHSSIPIDSFNSISLADENEEHFQAVFERRFLYDEKISTKELCCSATDFSGILESEFPRHRLAQSAFRAFLARKYSVTANRDSKGRWYTRIKARVFQP